MSNKWSSLNSKQEHGVSAAFEALTVLDTLSLAMATEPRDSRITFRDLLAWTQGSATALPIAYKKELLANPALRRDFDRLLARVADWRCERAAAASSGLLDTRAGDGFRLRLKPSRAALGQVYLLVEFTGVMPEIPPQTLIAKGANGDCVRLGMPDFQDGTAQILMEENSDMVNLVRDPKTEIFLW